MPKLTKLQIIDKLQANFSKWLSSSYNDYNMKDLYNNAIELVNDNWPDPIAENEIKYGRINGDEILPPPPLTKESTFKIIDDCTFSFGERKFKLRHDIQFIKECGIEKIRFVNSSGGLTQYTADFVLEHLEEFKKEAEIITEIIEEPQLQKDMEDITHISTFNLPKPAEVKKAKREKIRKKFEEIRKQHAVIIGEKEKHIISLYEETRAELDYLADVICGVEDEVRRKSINPN